LRFSRRYLIETIARHVVQIEVLLSATSHSSFRSQAGQCRTGDTHHGIACNNQ
jgi:hypothetical protein